MNELAILSLLISLIFADVVGLIPGGIIVPFYFVLFIEEPVKIAATVVTALAAMLVVRILSNYTILYGRRKFALYLVAGLCFKVLFTYAWFGNTYMFYNLSMTIGHLVPGILGSTMEKQGVGKTLLSLGVVVFIIRMLQIALL